MKKTLIAAAALAVSAGAMAEVTITGVFDTTLRLNSYDAGASGVDEVKTTRVGRDGSGTSGLYFNAKEDLGGGLTGLGFYELDVSPWQSDVIFNGGEKYAGLQGAFGTIRLGSPNTPSLAVQGVRAGLFGTKDGGRAVAGGAGANGSAGGALIMPTGSLMGVSLTRFNGSIRYDTPNFSGFSAALNFVPESDDAELTAALGDFAVGDAIPEQGAITDIGFFYRAGAINFGLSMYSEGEDQGGSAATAAAPYARALNSAKITQTSAAIQYNAGFAIFGAGLNQTKWEDGTESLDLEYTGTNVLATVPLSEALSLGINYQMGEFKDGDKLTQLAVGANYALSKLTSVYARYVTTSSDANQGASAASGTIAAIGAQKDPSATTMLVGLMTKF